MREHYLPAPHARLLQERFKPHPAQTHAAPTHATARKPPPVPTSHPRPPLPAHEPPPLRPRSHLLQDMEARLALSGSARHAAALPDAPARVGQARLVRHVYASLC